MPGTLFVVATPIGNLEDITLRALRVLREVKLIAAEDTRHTGNLLRHYSISTPTTSFHEHNERQKLPHLLDHLASGNDLAVVSDAGTPGISDPGARLVHGARQAGFPVIVVPGPSAAIAGLVGSGFPTEAFLFVGFPPRRSHARNKWLLSLASAPYTLVAFEAPHRVRETLQAASEIFGQRTIAVGRELTKLHEEWVIGPINSVLAKLHQVKSRGEYTIVFDKTGQGSAEQPNTHLCCSAGVISRKTNISRRQAISMVAKQHGLRARDVYAAIEKAKNLV